MSYFSLFLPEPFKILLRLIERFPSAWTPLVWLSPPVNLPASVHFSSAPVTLSSTFLGVVYALTRLVLVGGAVTGGIASRTVVLPGFSA